MKKMLLLSLLTIIVFGIVTILSISDKRPVDGNYLCGFPLTFHTKFSEMVYPNPTSEMDMSRTNYLFLVVDILFTFLLSVSILRIFKYLKLRFQKNS